MTAAVAVVDGVNHVTNHKLKQTSDTTLTADQILLTWLCTEIARDGGASLVTSLKDHYWTQSTKRLNALLVESAIGKAKLLKFLEYYSPSIFQVDRATTPHWVVLTDPTPSNPYIRCRSETSNECQDESARPAASHETLRLKALYVLRRRQARLVRRSQQHLYVHDESHKVNLDWMIRQCPWELHFYLRAVDYYRRHVYHNDQEREKGNSGVPMMVHPVMSQTWREMVREPFQKFFLVDCAEDLDVDQAQSKVWLKEHSTNNAEVTGELEASTGNGATSLVTTTGTAEHTMKWFDPLIDELIRLVQKDGATQVLLGLLLSRHASLKSHLGGRDLWLIYQNHSERFATSSGVLHVFQRPPSRDVYLQWKPTTTTTTPGADETDLSKIRSDPSANSKPRMKVDAVGLFSVTNSRWASAIANIIIQCCQNNLRWNVTEMIAIEMTASVGGMTLGLAKAKTTFSKILAMEIDATRARLCEENMRDHGISKELVQVIHTDSVESIPTFPNRCCILIDPPWGGEYYKEFKDQPPLQLGQWKLEDVILKIAQFVPECVVGVRLPVTLKVQHFLDHQLARERGLKFECLSIRKLSVQLLVVIRLVGKDSAHP